MTRSLRITTGARLHFGLLDTAAPFGGCGVMIDQPETVVQVSEAAEFGFSQNESAVDHQERAIAIAHRLAELTGNPGTLPPVQVQVLRAAPPHTGLGSGTQLSLAIAEGLLRMQLGQLTSTAASSSLPKLTEQQHDIWLRAADRGRRSAVGTYGYLHGGLIVEGLQQSGHHDSLNELHERVEIPAAWRVAVLLPATKAVGVICGDQEQAKFDALQTVTVAHRDTLAAILRDELLPAIEMSNFANFAAAANHYNYQSGRLFADVQGGAYNGEATTRIITQLRSSGLAGVGQSSWGPGVFVWWPNDLSAAQFRSSYHGAQHHVFIAQPQATGRQLEVVPID